MSLICSHRGERLENRGTIAGGTVPLHLCGHFKAPCSTAITTHERFRCCRDCPELPSNRGRLGITTRVMRQGCRTKCVWAWAVLLDGVVKASGNEETEEAARAEAEAEAEAEARALAELV